MTISKSQINHKKLKIHKSQNKKSQLNKKINKKLPINQYNNQKYKNQKKDLN